MKINTYVKRHAITLLIVSDDGIQRDANRWEHHAFTVRLLRADGALGAESPDISYRLGMAHTGEPEVDDVLNSCLLDAECYDNAASFEDFCADFGYDTDSRRAEAMYRACGDVSKWLRAFVGGEAEFSRLQKCERL